MSQFTEFKRQLGFSLVFYLERIKYRDSRLNRSQRKMSDLTETCEAIATYYKAITIWRWTDQQELQTLSFQLSNEFGTDEINETVDRLKSALHQGNLDLDRLGQLAFVAVDLTNEAK